MHPINIAILTPSKNSYTETFIHNHIVHLPFNKTIIYGDDIPYKVKEEDSYLPSKNLFDRIFAKFFSQKEKNNNELKLIKLKEHLINNKIQLVLAEYVITGSLVFEICKELNIPIIATGLGYDLSIYDVLKNNEIQYKKFLSYCSAVIIVAKSMEKVLLNFGCSPDKIIHSPAGATSDFTDIKPAYTGKQIFGIGRFIDKKAPHLSILAFNYALKKHPDAKLVLAGDGPLLSFCQDLVRGLGIEKNVDFVGKISQQQQREYLECSVIFIQHSRIAANGDSEGTPVSIVEASAAGLPVVSTKHAGIIDVIIQDKTGFLVEEGDVATMHEKISYLLDNRNVIMRMGNSGKENIKLNFTLTHHIEKIEKTILRILKK